MKTNICLFILCISFTVINAQNADNGKLSLRTFYSPVTYGKSQNKNFIYHFGGLNLNYGINKYLEFGAFCSYSRINVVTNIQDQEPINEYSGSSYTYGSIYTIEKSGAENFGFNINYHVLPYFINTKNLRYDLYFTGKVGGFYVNRQNMTYTKIITPEVSIGSGLVIKFTKRFAVFGEYNYGSFIHYNHRWQFGLQFLLN